MTAYQPRGIFDPEITAKPCRFPCDQLHAHDWPKGSTQYLDGGSALGGQGVDLAFEPGATAQNNYRPLPNFPTALYQCSLCTELVTEADLSSHVCPT